MWETAMIAERPTLRCQPRIVPCGMKKILHKIDIGPLASSQPIGFNCKRTTDSKKISGQVTYGSTPAGSGLSHGRTALVSFLPSKGDRARMQDQIALIDRIKSTYATLRPSERRVADYILSHITECAKATIVELAEWSGVSQPTVIRFVRAVGFDGYRSFRYAFLRESGGMEAGRHDFTPLGGFDLKPWDRLAELPLKEARVTAGLLDDALKSLSPQALEQAVSLLANARTIDIYGVENSFAPAMDLLTKLTYLGLNCRMHTDAYLQQISAAHLGRTDVAVAFSHSGRSVDTVKAVRQAKKAGADTIIVTSGKAPRMEKYADVRLCTGGSDSAIYGTSIFSRVPDSALVDLIYMGIILSDYERFSANLDKSGAVIADRGYGENQT